MYGDRCTERGMRGSTHTRMRAYVHRRCSSPSPIAWEKSVFSSSDAVDPSRILKQAAPIPKDKVLVVHLLAIKDSRQLLVLLSVWVRVIRRSPGACDAEQLHIIGRDSKVERISGKL